MKILLLIMAGMVGLVLLTAGLLPALAIAAGTSACSAIAWDRGKGGGSHKQLTR